MTIFLWLFYILGQFFAMWKRASLSAKSQLSPWNNIREYFIGHGPQMGINFLLSTGLFWTVWHDTTFLSRLLQIVGVDKNFDVPLNPFTAAIYGVASDAIMDFLATKVLAILGITPTLPKQDP
jgi:hypothetical protein